MLVLAYYISYGPYDARTPADPSVKYIVGGWVLFFFGVSVGLWRWFEAGRLHLLFKHLQIEPGFC